MRTPLLSRKPWLLVALAGPGLVYAAMQGDVELPSELHRAHLDAVARERIELVRDAWADAPPDRREAVVDLFQRRRRPYDRAVAAPAPEVIDEARRILASGARAAGGASWQERLAASLDLRVRPGAFQAREDGLGEPTTVHVERLFEVLVPSTVELGLDWIGPDGSARRARTEPIDPSAWTAAGFDMYVRPPASAAGRWSLAPVVEHEGERFPGVPVAVDCVVDLSARVSELARRLGGEPSPVAAELGPRIAAWIELGVRPASALPMGVWLALALGEDPRAEAGPVPVPIELEGAGLAWGFGDGPSDAGAPVLLLGTEGAAHPLELLSGSRGSAWRELARSLGAVLLASDLPAIAEPGAPALGELVGRLGDERSGAQLVLVLLGDAGVLFPSCLRNAGGLGVDRLVLDGPPAGGARPELRLGIPVLALDALASRDERLSGGEGGAAWTWIRHREPGFLAELSAPDEIGAWMRAAGPGEPSDR